jgi:hypothetical protein
MKLRIARNTTFIINFGYIQIKDQILSTKLYSRVSAYQPISYGLNQTMQAKIKKSGNNKKTKLNRYPNSGL